MFLVNVKYNFREMQMF